MRKKILLQNKRKRKQKKRLNTTVKKMRGMMKTPITIYDNYRHKILD